MTRAVAHVPDISKDLEYTLPAATTIGYRSVLAVPMMHEGVARGTILVARDVVAPFSDTHIALIQTFADQAVIALYPPGRTAAAPREFRSHPAPDRP